MFRLKKLQKNENIVFKEHKLELKPCFRVPKSRIRVWEQFNFPANTTAAN